MATLGRNVPNPPDAGYGYGAAGEMRATKVAAPATPFWVGQIAVRAGRRAAGSNVTASLGCFAVNGDGSIGARLGYTDEFTISTAMEDNAGGAYYLVDVVAPFLVSSVVAVAFLGEGAGYTLGQDNSGAIMYVKTGQSSIPSSWGSGTSSPQGAISVALVGETNVAPDVPSSRVPSGAGTITDATPAMSFIFRDDNEAVGSFGVGSVDHLQKFRIKVKQNGITKWDYEAFATADEIAARAVARDYAGTALVDGDFTWAAEVQDAAGLWSGESSYLTVTLSTGLASQAISPVGLITDSTPDFSSKYINTAGNSTHVQLMLEQGGVTVQTGTKRALAVAPGTTSATTWAQSGFTELNLGQLYRLKAKYFVGAADSGWDEGILFRVDARPTAPSNLSPPNGATRTSRPTIRFLTTDVGDVVPALGGEVELVTAADVLIAVRAATWDATLGRFALAVNSTDLPAPATIKWRARGTDPVGAGPWSSQYVYNYVSGPMPVITSPTSGQILTTNTLTVTYTATGQVRRRGIVYESATGTAVYDTGEETTASLSFAVPSGPLLDAVGSYYVQVSVWDALNIQGDSDVIFFVVDIPSPAAVADFSVVADTGRFDPPDVPSIAHMRWTPPVVDGFGAYYPWRRVVGQAMSSRVVLAEIPARSISEFLDTRPASGVDYEWGLEYTVKVGDEMITSVAASGVGRIDLLYTVISDMVDGHERRVVLRYWSDRSRRPVDNRQIVSTWSGKPIQIVDALDYDVVEGTWRLIDEADNGANVLDLIEAADALRRPRSDLTPTTVCYRDPRRRVIGGAFAFEEGDGQVVPTELDASVTETDWTEGVS